MKHKSLIFSFVALLLLATVAVAQSSTAVPKLAIAQAAHNLGEVKRGTQAQYSFTFKNEGTADLLINNVVPACGCTASDFTKVVAPGQEGKVTLSVNTTGFMGAIAKSAEVQTNDPQKPQFTLILSMVVRPDEAPKLVIGETSFNVGEVKKGSLAQHTFTLKNEGSGILEIKNVAPMCGCTATDFTKTIAPGQEGKVTLSVDTSTFSGAIAKSAEVYTNDPQKEQFTLMLNMIVVGDDKLKGVPVGAFVVGPSNQWQARAPRGLSANGIIAVTNTSTKPIRITKMETGSEAFNVKMDTLQEGQRYSLNFTSKETLPAGVHKQIVKLMTDNPEQPVLEVSLEVNVYPAVSVSPASLNFDKVNVSDPEADLTFVSKFVWVRLGRGAGLEIKSLTSDLPFIKAKVESVNDGQIVIRVGFSEKPAKGTHTGKLRVETNHNDVKLVEVPLTINAQ